MHQDTDSDVAEQRDSGKVKVKWTQDEVTAVTCPRDLHTLSLSPLQRKQWSSRRNKLISWRLQDDKLKMLVQKLGTSDWKCVASHIPVSLTNSCCLL